MTKAELVERLKTDQPSCLTNARDDEPVFVLRAQDKLAPFVIKIWANVAKLLGAPNEKVGSALNEADRMIAWATKNGDKVPD